MRKYIEFTISNNNYIHTFEFNSIYEFKAYMSNVKTVKFIKHLSNSYKDTGDFSKYIDMLEKCVIGVPKIQSYYGKLDDDDKGITNVVNEYTTEFGEFLHITETLTIKDLTKLTETDIKNIFDNFVNFSV